MEFNPVALVMVAVGVVAVIVGVRGTQKPAAQALTGRGLATKKAATTDGAELPAGADASPGAVNVASFFDPSVLATPPSSTTPPAVLV